MDWKDKLLRLFAEGLTDSRRQALDSERVVRALDRIEADPDLAAHLDTLDAAELRREFLRLYEASEPADEASPDANPPGRGLRS